METPSKAQRPFRLTSASWLYVMTMVGMSMVAGIWPVALSAWLLVEFADAPAGLVGASGRADDTVIWASGAMLGCGVVVALLAAALGLAIGYGRRGGRVPLFLLASLVPAAIAIYLVGNWTDQSAVLAVGVVLLAVTVVAFLAARRVGKVPVERHALVDPNYSLVRPWTYQLASLRDGPRNADGAGATRGDETPQGTHQDGRRFGAPNAEGPEPVVVVKNWSATLVGLLVLPGVLGSCVLLARGHFWLFLGAAAVSLAAPWVASQRLRWRRLVGTRREGQDTALSTLEVAVVFLATVGFVVGAGWLSDLPPSVFDSWSPQVDQGAFKAVVASEVASTWIAFGAFCVPLFGRRLYAAATTRAWVSWGVYLLTVVATFVAGGGWPVAGSRWQGWFLFAALILVATTAIWQLRRVRPGPKHGSGAPLS